MEGGRGRVGGRESEKKGESSLGEFSSMSVGSPSAAAHWLLGTVLSHLFIPTPHSSPPSPLTEFRRDTCSHQNM